jgi:hypothetical protein
LHELDAGLPVDFFAREDLAGGFHHTVRASIAVVVWISNQLVGGIEQPKIDTPGIQPNSSKGAVSLCGSDTQTILNLGPQPQDIPLNVVSHAYWTVQEAVNFIQLQTVIKTPQYSAPAFRSQVNREK